MTINEMYNPIFMSSFQTFLAILAVISFGLACRKRRDLLSWFPGIILLCIGISFMGIGVILNSDFFELLAYIFSLATSIIIFISVAKEYYNIFMKNKPKEKDKGYEAYRGDLNNRCVTIAEVLRLLGYSPVIAR